MQSESEYESVGLSDVEEPGSNDENDGPVDVLDRELGDGEDFLERIPAKPAKMSMAARMAVAREGKLRRAAAATAAEEVRDEGERKEVGTKHRRKAGDDLDTRRKSLEGAVQRRRKQEREAEEEARRKASDANERRAALVQRMKKEAIERKRVGEKSPSQAEKKSGKKVGVAKRGPGRPRKKPIIEMPLLDSENESDQFDVPQNAKTTRTRVLKNPSPNPTPESDSNAENAVESEAEDVVRRNPKASQKVIKRASAKENDLSDTEYDSDGVESSEADDDLAENVEAALLNAPRPSHVKSPLSGAAKRAHEEKLRKDAVRSADLAADKPQEVAAVAKPPEKRKRGRPRKNPIAVEAAANKGGPVELSQVERTQPPQPYQSPTRNARKRKLGQDVGVTASQQLPKDGVRGPLAKELGELGAQAGTAVVNPEATVHTERRKGKQKAGSVAKRASSGVKRAGVGKGGSSRLQEATGVKQSTRGMESLEGMEGAALSSGGIAKTVKLGRGNTSAVVEEGDEESTKPRRLIDEDVSSPMQAKTQMAGRMRLGDGSDATANIQKQAVQTSSQVAGVGQQQRSEDEGHREVLAPMMANGTMTEDNAEKNGSNVERPAVSQAEHKGTGTAETLNGSIDQAAGRSAKRRKTSAVADRTITPASASHNVEQPKKAAYEKQREPKVVDLTTPSSELELQPPEGQQRQQGEKQDTGTGSNKMEGVTKPDKPEAMQSSGSPMPGLMGSTKTVLKSVAPNANEPAAPPALRPYALPSEIAARDVGFSWAVVAVTMLERLQRQYVEFKRMEAQTINVSLESLQQGEMSPSAYSTVNSWLSLEERRDLKQQRLCSAIETAREKLVRSQEKCLTEFAKEVADALDEANNLEHTTLGDIVKKDRRLGDALVGVTPRFEEEP